MIRPIVMLLVFAMTAPFAHTADDGPRLAIEKSVKELTEIVAGLPAKYQKAGKTLPEAVATALRTKQEQGIAFAAQLAASPSPADHDAAQGRAQAIAELLETVNELRHQIDDLANFVEQFSLANGTPFGDRYLAYQNWQLAAAEKTVLQIAETGKRPLIGVPGGDVKYQILTNAVSLVQFQKETQREALIAADHPLIDQFNAFADKFLAFAADGLTLIDGLPADLPGFLQLKARQPHLDDAWHYWRQALQVESARLQRQDELAALGDSPLLKQAAAAARAYQEAVRNFADLSLTFRPDNAQDLQAMTSGDQAMSDTWQHHEAMTEVLDAAMRLVEIGKEVDEHTETFNDLVDRHPLLKQSPIPAQYDQLIRDIGTMLVTAKKELVPGDKLAALFARQGLEARLLGLDQFLDFAQGAADDLAIDARIEPHLDNPEIQALNKRLAAERAELAKARKRQDQLQMDNLFKRHQIEQIQSQLELSEGLESKAQGATGEAHIQVGTLGSALSDALDVIESKQLK